MRAENVRRIDGPQGKLCVDDGGRGGLPVVFVHGNGGNLKQWAAQLVHLRKSRRAVAFDSRGMGESTLPANGDYSVGAFADDVASVVDALTIDRFVLVGHSFGGAVVGAYAGRHPARLAGLVFSDTAGDLTDTPVEELETLRQGFRPENYDRFTQQWFEAILVNATAQTRAAVLRSLRSTPPEAFIGAAITLYRYHPSAALENYHGPRLSIASYLAESPLAIHRSLDRVPVRIMKGVSHWLMMDRPAEFNRILDRFLASVQENNSASRTS